MASDRDDSGDDKEARILRVMRQVLTTIVKDTATAPGMKHPLSDSTVEDIRQCLGLIAAREQEILRENETDSTMRPRFTDDPAAQDSVVVPINKLTTRKNPENE
ncbi:MAG: segregation and condensation protein A [Acidiferrobacterales bacterium]